MAIPNYDTLAEGEVLTDEDEYIDEDDAFEAGEEAPSHTYAIRADDTVSGFVDGVDAVRQSAYLILNTERYGNAIYSWDYGAEFNELYGMPIDYCIVALEQLIAEALTRSDDRIESVSNFIFSADKRAITAKFTVHTVLGDTAEMEQRIDV